MPCILASVHTANTCPFCSVFGATRFALFFGGGELFVGDLAKGPPIIALKCCLVVLSTRRPQWALQRKSVRPASFRHKFNVNESTVYVK